jgi:hypothetical protein
MSQGCYLGILKRLFYHAFVLLKDYLTHILILNIYILILNIYIYMYREKYLKYKFKYIQLKIQQGGGNEIVDRFHTEINEVSSRKAVYATGDKFSISNSSYSKDECPQIVENIWKRSFESLYEKLYGKLLEISKECKEILGRKYNNFNPFDDKLKERLKDTMAKIDSARKDPAVKLAESMIEYNTKKKDLDNINKAIRELIDIIKSYKFEIYDKIPFEIERIIDSVVNAPETSKSQLQNKREENYKHLEELEQFIQKNNLTISQLNPEMRINDWLQRVEQDNTLKDSKSFRNSIHDKMKSTITELPMDITDILSKFKSLNKPYTGSLPISNISIINTLMDNLIKRDQLEDEIFTLFPNYMRKKLSMLDKSQIYNPRELDELNKLLKQKNDLEDNFYKDQRIDKKQLLLWKKEYDFMFNKKIDTLINLDSLFQPGIPENERRNIVKFLLNKDNEIKIGIELCSK